MAWSLPQGGPYKPSPLIYERPDEGRILAGDVDLDELDPAAWRRAWPGCRSIPTCRRDRWRRRSPGEPGPIRPDARRRPAGPGGRLHRGPARWLCDPHRRGRPRRSPPGRCGGWRWPARSSARARCWSLDEPTASLDADTAEAVGDRADAAAARPHVAADHARSRAGARAGRPRRSARRRPDLPAAELSGERRERGRAAPVRIGRALARPHVAAAAAGRRCWARWPIAPAIGLMATSGYLISRAALRPPILALAVAIVGVRFFGISRGRPALPRPAGLPRRRAARDGDAPRAAVRAAGAAGAGRAARRCARATC